MPTEVARDQLQFKCGCSKLLPSYDSWRAHRGHHQHKSCADPYSVVIPDLVGSGGAGAAPQARYSSQESDSSDESPDEADGQGSAAGEPDGREDWGGGGAGAGQDPPLPRTPRDHSDYGAPRPSAIPESKVSFPVKARFAYDLYRMAEPRFKGTFNEFVYDMFELALWTMGLHPGGIWTKPFSPPPPGSVAPVYDDAGVEQVLKGMESAA
ncbi:MAG: hypothetical protein ACREN4_07160 [Candidatus Dormibacteria bacterium]